MEGLKNVQVAVLATDGFEEAELTGPVQALREAGIRTVIIAPHEGQIQGFRHHDKSQKVDVELTLDRAEPASFDALVLPGGALNADSLRVDRRVQQFIRTMQSAGKPIAAICHAPWELISAGVVHGRKLTSYHTIQDDVRNAGGQWVDEEVVVDRNWVSSRQPSDIPAFNRELLRLISKASHSASKAAY
jgi:protease I